MQVKIGHARMDENNGAKNGKAGDQTSKEVVIQDWYSHKSGWQVVFRPKDTAIAEKIAKAAEDICTNDNIGYDQSKRTTLYYKAKAANWNIYKITEKCECDCSSFVTVCVNVAGIAISKDMYTGNQKAVLSSTGKFKVLTNKKYLTSQNYLKRGDVLLGQGHTAIVVSDNLKIPTVDSAKSFSESVSGRYKVTATQLNIRCGGGTAKSVIAVLSKDTEVRCYGYYTEVLGTKWLYVQFIAQDKQYTGFASAKYLTRF